MEEQQQTPVDSTEALASMAALVTEIAKALVDEPEAVEVEIIPDGPTAVLRLHVSPEDIGKLIGKQGRTARSLRTILGAASMKFHQRFSLDIVELEADDESSEAGDESSEAA
jgi:predicted RNA-binding protein YlqC (UPF0109 family)